MWAVARSVSNALSTYEHVEAMFRLRWDKLTQDYMARRTAESRTKREVIRCLKRYVAREIYVALKGMASDRTTTTLAHEVA